MSQAIVRASILVKDYDEAIDYFRYNLGFTVSEDELITEKDKRWVVMSAPGTSGAAIVLVKAKSPQQLERVGNQAADGVFLFLGTTDFWTDYLAMQRRGVVFVTAPQETPYGIVAIFTDLYGNKWDLIQFKETHPMHKRVW